MTSDRRRARGRARGSTRLGGLPGLLLDLSDPRWHDAEALVDEFGLDIVDDRIQSRLAMGGRVDHSVVNRWAIAHGFEDPHHRGAADWRRLRSCIDQAREAAEGRA